MLLIIPKTSESDIIIEANKVRNLCGSKVFIAKSIEVVASSDRFICLPTIQIDAYPESYYINNITILVMNLNLSFTNFTLVKN